MSEHLQSIIIIIHTKMYVYFDQKPFLHAICMVIGHSSVILRKVSLDFSINKLLFTTLMECEWGAIKVLIYILIRCGFCDVNSPGRRSISNVRDIQINCDMFVSLSWFPSLSRNHLTLFIWDGKFSVMARLFVYLWSIGNSISLFEWELPFHLSHKFRRSVKINVKTDVVWLVMNHNLWLESMFLFDNQIEDIRKKEKWHF